MEMDSKSRALDKIYKRRDRYEIPEWQRQEVWSRSKKQNLIDSILRGWKLPKFYFLLTNKSPEEFEVVDGQQRLVAIFEFFENDLPLAQVSADTFGGKFYEELPDNVQDNFDDYEIQFDLIENATDQEVKDFFQRLQEGLQLTSSEKLNSIHSNLRDFVAKLSIRPFFKNKIVVSDNRYGHFDIVAKATAIEIDGLEVGTRYDDLRAVFESQASFSEDSSAAKRLLGAIDFLDKAFDTQNPRLRNRTVVQSAITLCTRLFSTGKIVGLEKKIGFFLNHFLDELTRQVQLGHAATDRDYLDFQKTVTANVRSGPSTRQKILLRKLFFYAPELAEQFDAATLTESGMTNQIRLDADAIISKISQINESYSAEHGDDLFKPTNRTAASQAIIGKPIGSIEGYKNLIENLYFLFHEGVANRLGDKKPSSFEDITQLRTHIEHDIDHGPKKTTRKKKLKHGKTFKKYSGASSPEGLDPELFMVVHANLLQALRRDIESLTW